MPTDPFTHAAPEPPVASGSRLQSAVQRPARLSALTAEGLLEGSPEPVFDRFARVAAHAARVPVALVSVVAGDRQHFIGMSGLKQPWADARQTPLSHSFCQHVVANEAPLVVEDAPSDVVLCASLAISDLDVVAYAGFPILSPDGLHVLGSLCAIDDHPRAWEADELEALREVALLVGNELQSRSIVRRLAFDARTDVLTGLTNRRGWDEELPRALHHAERLSHSLAAVLIDIDHFKAFNDRHGHQAGDVALRHVGQSWRGHVRDIDVLARIGGEEFGLLLLGCTPSETLKIVDRLRAEMPDGLTASAGIAVWSAPLTEGQLVAAADRALYRAKSDGRDRACIAESPESRASG